HHFTGSWVPRHARRARSPQSIIPAASRDTKVSSAPAVAGADSPCASHTVHRMVTLPLLPATVIGSWAFPGWYAKFCDDVARRPEAFGADDRDGAVRDAARLAIDDQARAGADIIPDGEMQRVDFTLGFYDRLRGIRPLPTPRRWGPPAHDQRSRYECIAPL